MRVLIASYTPPIYKRVLRTSEYASVGMDLLDVFNWASDPSVMTKVIPVYCVLFTKVPQI